jgi:Ran GTPase-activating protein (RanGAP) involved in mRNA processing and transport
MSFTNDSTVLSSTVDDDGALLSSTFLEFCDKVRSNDPFILPELGKPFRIGRLLSENEDIALADALLENDSVTYVRLGVVKYTKSSAEAMAKCMRASKRLQHICLIDYQILRQHEEIFCCFMLAIQESTSLKELDINLPLIGGPSSLAFESTLTRTQSLRSLTLRCLGGLQEDIAVATTLSGLKMNTTLRELTLDVSRGATTVSPILNSLRNHPLLRRLCLRGHVVDLTGLEAVLLSDDSKITELEIHNTFHGGLLGPFLPLGLTQMLQALGRHPALIKLNLIDLRLGRDEARLLRMVLCNNTSLQTLVLRETTLGRAGLAELAPALLQHFHQGARYIRE